MNIFSLNQLNSFKRTNQSQLKMKQIFYRALWIVTILSICLARFNNFCTDNRRFHQNFDRSLAQHSKWSNRFIPQLLLSSTERLCSDGRRRRFVVGSSKTISLVSVPGMRFSFRLNRIYFVIKIFSILVERFTGSNLLIKLFERSNVSRRIETSWKCLQWFWHSRATYQYCLFGRIFIRAMCFFYSKTNDFWWRFSGISSQKNMASCVLSWFSRILSKVTSTSNE